LLVEIPDGTAIVKVSHSDVTTESVTPPALYPTNENWVITAVIQTRMPRRVAFRGHSFLSTKAANEIRVRKHELFFFGVSCKVTQADTTFRFSLAAVGSFSAHIKPK
jgi:hypothetical protein